MRSLLVIAICFLNVACGKGQIGNDFVPLVSQFEDEARARGKNLTVSSEIKFGHLDTGTSGLCQSGLGHNTITILKGSWDSMNDDGKRALLYHELGHCELGKSHDEHESRVDIDGTNYSKTSIMYPELNKVLRAYSLLEKQYLDELFE
jgi:hypothetical protein